MWINQIVIIYFRKFIGYIYAVIIISALKKYLKVRRITLAFSIIFLGFYLGSSISISSYGSLLLGYLPPLKRNSSSISAVMGSHMINKTDLLKKSMAITTLCCCVSFNQFCDFAFLYTSSSSSVSATIDRMVF